MFSNIRLSHITHNVFSDYKAILQSVSLNLNDEQYYSLYYLKPEKNLIIINLIVKSFEESINIYTEFDDEGFYIYDGNCDLKKADFEELKSRIGSLVLKIRKKFTSIEPLFDNHIEIDLKPSEVELVNVDCFDPLIFKDQDSYDLFLFLVEKYAVNNSVSQFSQIFHWLKGNEKRIKNNSGTKYRKYVKIKFELSDKFSRIEDEKRDERPTLNDYYKGFNQLK